MERITATEPAGPARYGHEFRYRLAAGFIDPFDVVVDAACGVGYGRKLLGHIIMAYHGIDSIDRADTILPPSQYWQVDLETWKPPFRLDVFLGFETIEHLNDYGNYVTMALESRKWILVSTPIIPTVGVNPHHVHDFKPGDMRALFEDANWEHYQAVQQPSELAEITILRRRT
jgi:trans-aconitate methyltransferase